MRRNSKRLFKAGFYFSDRRASKMLQTPLRDSTAFCIVWVSGRDGVYACVYKSILFGSSSRYTTAWLGVVNLNNFARPSFHRRYTNACFIDYAYIRL